MDGLQVIRRQKSTMIIVNDDDTLQKLTALINVSKKCELRIQGETKCSIKLTDKQGVKRRHTELDQLI